MAMRQEVSMNKWKAEKTIARTRTRQLRLDDTFC